MKKDFYIRLQDRIERLGRYRNKPYRLATKLLWWVMKCCFTPAGYSSKRPIVNQVNNTVPCLTPKIALLLKGGVGDIVIGGVLSKSLKDKLGDNSQIDLFLGGAFGICKLLFKEQTFFNALYKANELDYEKYDLVIELDVYFPKVVYRDCKVIFTDGFLEDYVKTLEDFHQKFPTITRTDRVFDQMMLLELLGKNRITCLDVGNLLGIEPSTLWDIKVDSNVSETVYQKWPQLKKPFITVGRGVDGTNADPDSIRLWSVEKYNQWIALFKEKFPNVTVVQLGVSKDRCESLDVDLNLLGETTFEEVLFILKASALHLDGECGYVHLRHFLTQAKGLNVVLFGPTSPKIKGYEENVNIRNDNICSLKCCEWIAGGTWQSWCIKNGKARAECVESLTPEYVMEYSYERIKNCFPNN